MYYKLFKQLSAFSAITAFFIFTVTAYYSLPKVDESLWQNSQYVLMDLNSVKNVSENAILGTMSAFLTATAIVIAWLLLMETIAICLYRSADALLNKDLDVDCFRMKNDKFVLRLRERPSLSHTRAGFVVRINAASANAEGGDIEAAVAILKDVLSDGSLQTKTNAPIRCRALLNMERYLYALGDSESAEKCLEEICRVFNKVNADSGNSHVQGEIRYLLMCAEVAKMINDGEPNASPEELIRLLDGRSCLEKIRLTSYIAMLYVLLGNAEQGRKMLSDLGPKADKLYTVKKTVETMENVI